MSDPEEQRELDEINARVAFMNAAGEHKRKTEKAYKAGALSQEEVIERLRLTFPTAGFCKVCGEFFPSAASIETHVEWEHPYE